jgi:uncharacterized protein (TIGR03083 family)
MIDHLGVADADDLVDSTSALRRERSALIRLLGSLERSEWSTPTECSKWTVKDIATHLIGNDLSLLSRQRDSANSGLIGFAQSHPGLSFLELLDGFNDAFVDSTRFLSEQLIVELLATTGEAASKFYESKSLRDLGEPVFWIGPEPAPYWMIALREFAERFVHHQQILRALDREIDRAPATTSGLDDDLAEVALQGFFRVVAVRLSGLSLPKGTCFALNIFEMTRGYACFERADDRWSISKRSDTKPMSELCVDRRAGIALMTKGLTCAEILQVISIDGDQQVGQVAREYLAANFGRTS